MVEINCPFCSSKINSKAKRCKYCFRYLIPKSIDINQLEEQSIYLNLELEKLKPELIQLIEISEFINNVLYYQDSNLAEIYLSEFINPFLNRLIGYNANGKSLELTSRFIKTCYKISEFVVFNSFYEKIAKQIERLEKLNELIIFSLNGINKVYDESHYFPVIYQTENEKFISGNLEILKVNLIIKKNLNKDNFYIIPSYKNLEERLFLQIRNSLQLSIKILKKYLSNNNKHEVIVKFENSNANYEGYSFGIVSTIEFVEELLTVYQIPLQLKKIPNIAFTGGVDSEGNILKVNEGDIEKKVELIFFSTQNIFIVPFENYNRAVEKLSTFQKLYPLRKLEIIGIKNIEELFGFNKLFNLIRLQ